MLDWPDNGAGDSERSIADRTPRADPRDDRDAPQISHSNREGWFLNVHRGHVKEAASAGSDGRVTLDAKPASVSTVSRDSLASKAEGSRLTAAAMAALSMTFRDGLIPQAKHDGRGVEAVEVVGSKFDGTGLENEQIGHTHVAFNVLLGRGMRGLDWTGVEANGDALPPIPVECPMPRFGGFGYTVTLGDDFRKRA